MINNRLRNKLSYLKCTILSIMKSPLQTLVFLKNIRGESVYENKKHIELATDWLLKAQQVGDDQGYSRGFYLYKGGWDKSYIETTGYIIPTLLKVSRTYNNKKYYDSALNAGQWLLSKQTKQGGFCGIDASDELVFDTGQVLYGLVALYELEESSQDFKLQYETAIEKAASWLCDVQDDDGSWTKYGYEGIAHSYYSRVSSILYRVGELMNNQNYKDCAEKHINWVISQQNEVGFFQKLQFTAQEKNSVLHSIIYVLEGLYDYYLMTKNEVVLQSMLKNAEQLKRINLERDLLLGSQYDDNFNCVNSERCMTGLAQWAGLAFKLHQLTKDEGYLHCARKTIFYLKSKQFTEGKVRGSLAGSVPFWGFYAKFRAINWGVKFFIDALLEHQKMPLSLIEESGLWIGECFKFSNMVDDRLTSTSYEYISILQSYVANSANVLDLGCGQGRHLDYFREQFQEKNILGVDPYYYDGKKVLEGDAYCIKTDIKFDLIYTIEALQHVKYLDVALAEIHKKLDDKGYFIICDRNPNSLLGYLKPIQEWRGKWMYPFDSPFREKWYGIKKWKKILNDNGFLVEDIKTFTGKNGRFGWFSRYSVIVARKNNG